ncbi:host-nuclease inhibitor protein Gam [Dickeya dianthicola]|jgi:phage host-nuclease inhibitor protein Gam|uniref:host-nuclease inhibitor Gam family protein n=1 Tax=Dickeya dianthicola TaxID=204039 RepID=UPI0003A17FAE|nr:host-nuclease inhibitor Gam family protein [Dickeya dianthicola]ATO34613.1 putative host-nuclease inhibitor protein [Dickeya dianthicola RNS04.9]MCA7001843.1 host-nuclease inhibitor Gam family protein [Dickeya dianthicola]MCI4155125.1 host-nuclease inhibitor Gam family protein [Dickeya dianthicola]MCI4233650.1 host-nuclease inhibitor Gam family protein [Dickeya dianthicola]MCI4239358.1 host-nuclease inhibitor Gam family protein [Dickeya dianthicola]
MKGKKRLKAAAAQYVAQTKDEVIAGIKQLGDIQRELIRVETEMNDSIAEITASHSPTIEQLKAKMEELQSGIQTWCEAHRDELTNGGKVKFANLTTGEVQWRNRPPSVSIRGVESVIEFLKRQKLSRFIRVKEEINKDAILNEPTAVKNIPGITIKKDVEDFSIIPFEQEVV